MRLAKASQGWRASLVALTIALSQLSGLFAATSIENQSGQPAEPSPAPDITAQKGDISSINRTTQTSLPKAIPTTTFSPTQTLPNNNVDNDDDDESEPISDDPSSCADLAAFRAIKPQTLTDNARLVDLQTCLQRKIKHQVKSSARMGLEIFEQLSLDSGCTVSLMNLASALAATKSFAIKFVDASAKMPSGVMKGLLSDYGDFDECLSIRSNPEVSVDLEHEEGAYSGKYCLLKVKMNYHATLGPNQTVPDGIMADGLLWDELVRNYWTSNSTKGFHLAVCVPSRCSNDDLSKIYKLVAERYNFEGELLSCQSSLDLKLQHEPDRLQLIIIKCLQLLLVLVLVGTLVELYVHPDGRAEKAHKRPCKLESVGCQCLSILRCFSVTNNWRIFKSGRVRYNDDTFYSHNGDDGNMSSKLEPLLVLEHMTMELGAPVKASGQLDPKQALGHLAGLRLVVLLWITLGHSFLYPSATNYQHYRSIINMNLTRDSIWFAATNFTLGIDMLLYMIGFALVYKIALLEDKKLAGAPLKELPITAKSTVALIGTKMLRLWPTYIVLIGLAIVAPLVSDGPMWADIVVERVGGSCRQNWWANLLFVNNLWPEAEICLPSSWFVSVTMACFSCSVCVLSIVRKFHLIRALTVLGSMIIGSCALPFYYAYYSQVPAPAIRMDETFVMEMDPLVFNLYTKFVSNLGPFLVGMAGGFYLVHTQINTLKSSETSNRPERNQAYSIGTLLSPSTYSSMLASSFQQVVASILVGCIAVGVLSTVFITDYSRVGVALYWSTHRVGWAIVTGYLVHQCATERWLVLRRLLALSALKPISKLGLIAYLVHPVLIHMHTGMVRDGLHVSLYNMLTIYITRIMLTFILAFMVYLLVELPLLSIQELLLSPTKPRSDTGSKLSRSLALQETTIVLPSKHISEPYIS